MGYLGVFTHYFEQNIQYNHRLSRICGLRRNPDPLYGAMKSGFDGAYASIKPTANLSCLSDVKQNYPLHVRFLGRTIV